MGITNYVVQYFIINPDYEEYIKETGDDSGTYRNLWYRYNFKTNKTVQVIPYPTITDDPPILIPID